MSLRDDLQQTKRGKAYLAVLDGVLAEEGFLAGLAVLEREFAGKDLHGLATVKRALKGDKDALLEAAEMVLQIGIRPSVHSRFPEEAP